MARSITDPHRQAQALAQVAEALAGAGQHQQAEAVARSITDPVWQAQALAQVAEALAGAGQHEQAARSRGWLRGGPLHHRPGLAGVGPERRVAGALAGAGQHQQAETVARSITDPDSQAQALARVAGALAGAGQHEQAAVVGGRPRRWPAPSPTRARRRRP